MQESSGGGRGTQSFVEPYRYSQVRGVFLVDQTQAQPIQTELSTPIQVGHDTLGQARFLETNVDSDGSASMLHDVNQVNDIQNNFQRSGPPPVEASPSLNEPSQVVPSQRSEAPLPRQNGLQQPSQDTVENGRETPSTFGVNVRSESNFDVNHLFPIGHSNIHGQSASGFSAVNMNVASGGQLISFPSRNRNLHQQIEPQVPSPSYCMLPEPHVEPVLSGDSLERRLGLEEYKKEREKCYKTYRDAGINDQIARPFAEQLLSYQNIGDVVKCRRCNNSQDMNMPFVHRQDCPVHLCQQAQRHHEIEPQMHIGSNDTGNRIQANNYERPTSENVPLLLPRTRDVAVPSASDLSSSFLHSESILATTSPTLGAVGGAERADTETTRLKRVENSGNVKADLMKMGFPAVRIQKVEEKYGMGSTSTVENFITCDKWYTSEASGASVMPNSHNTAGSYTLNSSLQYQTALSGNRSSATSATSTAGSHGITSPTAAVTHRSGSQDTAKYPTYSDNSARLASFHSWKHNYIQTPEALAEAGLCYTGTGDDCFCFWCGGVLRRWEANDNPWSEHARLFPNCKYVLNKRGHGFVKEIKKKSQKNENSGSFQQNSMVNPRPQQKVHEDSLKSSECQFLLDMGYEKEEVLQAIQVYNRKVPSGTKYSVEHLLDILEERKEHLINPPSLTARQSLRSSTSFNEINGQQASRAVLMNASYCQACNKRRVSISQFTCGHVVCQECAPGPEDVDCPCKICGEEVVQCVAIDSSKFRKQ